MGLISTAINGESLEVTIEAGSLTLPLTPRYCCCRNTLTSSCNLLFNLEKMEKVYLFSSEVYPLVLPQEHSNFFADFLKVPRDHVKLVYVGPDPREILINKPPAPAQGGGQINTTFADSGPY